MRNNTNGQAAERGDASTREPVLEDVRRALSSPLPGPNAHVKMAPQPRPGWTPDLTLPSDCRQGAVLILLYLRDCHLHLVLTRRTDTVRSHKGQISLPGGAREKDESLVQTALRETCEELDVPTHGTEIIGKLSPLYTPPSNYCIHPFVAFRPISPTFYPDATEVAEVIEVPLAILLDPMVRRVEYWTDARFDSPRRVPFFEINGQVVWGATAMILSEFVSLLEEEQGDRKGKDLGGRGPE